MRHLAGRFRSGVEIAVFHLFAFCRIGEMIVGPTFRASLRRRRSVSARRAAFVSGVRVRPEGPKEPGDALRACSKMRGDRFFRVGGSRLTSTPDSVVARSAKTAHHPHGEAAHARISRHFLPRLKTFCTRVTSSGERRNTAFFTASLIRTAAGAAPRADRSGGIPSRASSSRPNGSQ